MGILVDAEKFFDTLDLAVLVPKALALGYPPVFLYLGALMHRAARVLKADGTYSEALVVQKSILAGCTHSVDWTRAHFYDLLDDLHKNYRPVAVKSFVDDLALRMQGPKGTVAHRAVQAGKALLDGIVQRGGRISTKTVVLASTK